MTSVQELKTDLRGRSRSYSWGNWKIPEIYRHEKTGKGSTKHLLFFFHEGKTEFLKKKRGTQGQILWLVCRNGSQGHYEYLTVCGWSEQVSDRTVLQKWDCCCTPTKHRTAEKFLAKLKKKKESETAESILRQLRMQIKTKICGERGLLTSRPKFLQITFVSQVGRNNRWRAIRWIPGNICRVQGVF